LIGGKRGGPGETAGAAAGYAADGFGCRAGFVIFPERKQRVQTRTRLWTPFKIARTR
jgi:hypothetical protein